MLQHTRRVLALLVLVIFLATPLAGAEGLDTGSVFGSGGFSLGLWYPDFSELNDLIPTADFAGPVFLFGGGGSGATVPGWAFGGFGGGSSQTKGNAELSMGLGGGIVRKTFQLGKGYWFVGGMLGGGGADLYINNSPGGESVAEVINDPQNVNLTTGFLAVAPQIGVEIPLLDSVRLEATAGYMKTFGGNWRQRGGSELSGGQIDWDGPLFQLGIKFGGYAPANR